MVETTLNTSSSSSASSSSLHQHQHQHHHHGSSSLQGRTFVVSVVILLIVCAVLIMPDLNSKTSLPARDTTTAAKNTPSDQENSSPSRSPSHQQNEAPSSSSSAFSIHQFYEFEGKIQGKSEIPPEDAKIVQDPKALTRLGKGPHIEERPSKEALDKIHSHIPVKRWTNRQPPPPSDWINPRTLGTPTGQNPPGGRDEDWFEDFDEAKHPLFLKPLFFTKEEKEVFLKFREVSKAHRRGTVSWTTEMMKLILHDGSTQNNNSAIAKIISPWRPGRARPIVCEGRDYYSATFSIPSENIINDTTLATLEKTQDWATILPGKKSTYKFKIESEFRKDMERSYFSLTRRKFGWVTSRNMEILAAGSIPYFCGIEQMPLVGTLRHLPLDVLFAIKNWITPMLSVIVCQPPKKAIVGPIKKDSAFTREKYNIINKKMIQYTRSSLTTELAALHILSATSLKALPKSVLIIWSVPYSILMTGFINGLRRLGVKDVVDVPRRQDNYKGEECEKAKSKTYAKGWFFFCRTEESEGISRQNVGARIAEKEFDLVVFGISDYWTYYMIDPFEEVPYFSHVVKHYSRDRIVVINDADLIRPMTNDVAQKLMHNYTLYFKRETHTCGGFS